MPTALTMAMTKAATSVRGLGREGKSKKRAESSHRFQKKNLLSFCPLFPSYTILAAGKPESTVCEVQIWVCTVSSSLGSQTVRARSEMRAALQCTSQVCLGSGIDECRRSVVWPRVSGRRQESWGARESSQRPALRNVGPGVKVST